MNIKVILRSYSGQQGWLEHKYYLESELRWAEPSEMSKIAVEHRFLAGTQKMRSTPLKPDTWFPKGLFGLTFLAVFTPWSYTSSGKAKLQINTSSKEI